MASRSAGWLRRLGARLARVGGAYPTHVESLEMVPVGGARLPPWLGEALSARLGAPCAPAEPLPLDARWYNERKGQYLASAIVDALIDRADTAHGCAPGRWLLGFAEVDLYAPERTFVFGEATVGGCCAVVSTARLGAGADAETFRRRVLAEALHELGHVAGLDHCTRLACLMHPARTAADTDHRGIAPCRACARRFRAARNETGG